jgi:hypothetical protein
VQPVRGSRPYISLVEHPAELECGVELAATEFPPGYRRASIMQALLAAVGLLSSIAAWLARATFWWLSGVVVLDAAIPFTLIVILPINNQALRRFGCILRVSRRLTRIVPIASLVPTHEWSQYVKEEPV